MGSEFIDYTLLHGDCVEKMKTLSTESVDLILTDPPYNLANFMRDRQVNLKRMRSNFFGDAGWDDLDFEDWVINMDAFFAESARVLKKRGAMIVFMSLMKIETLLKISTKHKLYYKTTGIWHKTNPMPRNMNLHFINSVEGWVYFINSSKTGVFNNEGLALHDFVETSGASSGEKKYGGHPTQKPEQLMRHFVDILTNPGDVVLDPFMGAGTTGVVCKQLRRDFIGIDLSPQYVEIAEKRIKDASCFSTEKNPNLFKTRM